MLRVVLNFEGRRHDLDDIVQFNHQEIVIAESVEEAKRQISSQYKVVYWGLISSQEIRSSMTEAIFFSAQEEALIDIPEEFRSFIRTQAWDLGHSSGYEEVLGYVRSFAGSLFEPISAFKKRVVEDVKP
jgi:hypothetical protein